MICPNCGHSTPPGRTRCGHCNYKLPESAAPREANAVATVPCWNCAQANTPDAARCGQCNAKLPAQPAQKRREPQPGAAGENNENHRASLRYGK